MAIIYLRHHRPLQHYDPGKYSAIEHIAKTVYPCPDWRELLMLMLATRFDASGHPDDQPLVTVAGFISSADEWIGFEAKWKEMLGAFKITSLRMSDLMNRSSEEYCGWTETRQMKLLDAAIAIVREYTFHSFATVVSVAAFNAVASRTNLREMWANPYSLSARGCLSKINDWKLRQKWEHVPVEYMFEKGDKGQHLLRELMERDGYPDPIFKRKKDFIHPKTGILEPGVVSLQAADMIAHGFLWSFNNPTRDKPYTLDELERLPHIWKQYMTEKSLENLVYGGQVADELTKRVKGI